MTSRLGVGCHSLTLPSSVDYDCCDEGCGATLQLIATIPQIEAKVNTQFRNTTTAGARLTDTGSESGQQDLVFGVVLPLDLPAAVGRFCLTSRCYGGKI